MSGDNKFTPVKSLGEFRLIKTLTEKFDIKNESTIKGIGDDAAILDFKDNKIAISTDLLIEGIHIDLSYMPLKHVGYKAVAVNLSDICAMNTKATQITVSIAISNRFTVEALEELYEGIKSACDNYGVDLIGGDTTSSNKGMIISITALGSINEKDIVYRSTANNNDLLCVSGNLGGAYLGLQILEREKQVFIANSNMQPKLDNYAELVQRLLKPEPRYDIITSLKKVKVKPTSMIDISDGLSSETIHISSQSKLGVVIYEDKLPISETAYNTALELNIDPYVCALNGGDEYELLFTIKQSDYEKIKNIPDISVIGHMTPEENIYKIISKDNKEFPLKALGWNAFSK